MKDASTQEQARAELYATAFWKRFVNSILFPSVVGILLVAAWNDYITPYDDTDGPQGRSGMALYTDALTGCQYLATPRGGITPRLDREGRHICGGAP